MSPNPAQMEAALRLIGGDCERLTQGLCPDEPNWSPYAKYTADRWCDPCIARAGLAGTLPERDRDQFNARVRSALDRLDGTPESSVSLLSGIPTERLNQLGGFAQPAPTRRLRACVEAWPDCYSGGYDPSCCRFPKSCSATVYDPEHVDDDQLEPKEN